MRDAPATAADNVIAKERSHTRRVSRRTAFILVWAVGVPLGHGAAPWALSLLSRRHGWDPIRPGLWNVAGLMPIALGIAGLVWTMRAALVESPKEIELRSASFLVTRGPYAYSRNPMYVSELTLWLGWAIFYGHPGVLIGCMILFAVLVTGVRYEERVLDARFGERYRMYRSRVPRWLGTRHSLRGSILRGLLRVRRASVNWNMSVESLRATQEWADRLITPPRDIAIAPALTADVPAEWLTPARCASQGVIFYVHGGGWTVGLHNLERRMLARICKAAGVPALAVHYRLAPEQPFPAALEDCIASYRWLSRSGVSPRDIVVVGTSAGGNLALAMLMSLRDAGEALPVAAVLVSPMIDLAGRGESFRIDRDPAVRAGFALSMARHYAGGQDPRSPLLSPHRDVRGLPPLLLHVGGDELLLSDATQLRDDARSAGVDVTLAIWPGMWHGWHFFAPYLPEAREAVDDIGAFVRNHLTFDCRGGSSTGGRCSRSPLEASTAQSRCRMTPRPPATTVG